MSVKPSWELKSFNDLTTSELYAILKLRSEVFVVEQDCVYLDSDGKDAQALHLFALSASHCIGYSRLFDLGEYYDQYAAIGRVVLATPYRGRGWAYDLIAHSIAACQKNFGPKSIKISAQKHLQSFYENCGFRYKGEDYDEDGIPHCAMYYSTLQ